MGVKVSDAFLLLEDGGLLETERNSNYILLEESDRMADQVEIQIPKTRVVESSTFTANAYFRVRSTKTGDTPTTIKYRVDDITNNTVMVDWTNVTPAAKNVAITIPAAANAITHNESQAERRQITVMIDEGLSTQTTGQTMYKVRNVQGISS